MQNLTPWPPVNSQEQVSIWYHLSIEVKNIIMLHKVKYSANQICVFFVTRLIKHETQNKHKTEFLFAVL